MFLYLTNIFLVFALSLWPAGGGSKESTLKKTELDLPDDPEEFQHLRILLAENVSQVVVETNSPYRIFDKDERPLFKGDKIVATPIKAHTNGIQIGSQTFKDVPLTIQSEGDGIQLGKRVYRSALKIWRESAGAISVVNELDIEDYLKGVLPWEANPQWSPEALKAQAVASRTYALFRSLQHQERKFDVHQDIKSQVYGGRTLEKPQTNQAVDATQGEVLTYKGKVFPAFFHSTCGGHTTRADYSWDVEAHPALRGVRCEFCHASKHYRWKAEFTAAKIEAALRKRGYKVSGIRKISIDKTDESGRARNFVVEYSGNKASFHANEFRMWMDPMVFKSTLIRSITKKGNAFVFEGKGWGHGVGLCQYGMKALAELGYSYREILEHYYPGAEIKKLR